MEDQKIVLCNALIEAEKSVEMYGGLFNKAKATVRDIRQQLDDGFVNGNSRYSNGQLKEVRRDILGVLAGRWLYPRSITDAIHTHSADLVMREVHKLANDDRSDVKWNGRQGPASMYRRFRAVV